MIVQYIVGGLFALWALAQARMVLVYLGVIPSALGIVGSPTLVFIAALKAAIINPIRAALCFLVPWPMLLPALSATLALSPLAFALAFFGAFGRGVAQAAYPELSMLTEMGRKAYPVEVIRSAALRIAAVGVLTVGLWYFFAR